MIDANVILESIEVIYGLLEVFMLHFFCCIYLKPREVSRASKVSAWLLVALTIFLATRQPFDYVRMVVLTLTALYLYGVVMFQGKLLQKTKVILIYGLVSGVISAVIAIAFPWIMSVPVPLVLFDPFYRFCVFFIVKMLAFLVGYILLRQQKQDLKTFRQRILVVYSVAVYLLLLVLFELLYFEGMWLLYLARNISLIFLVVIVLALFIFNKYYNSKEASEVLSVKLHEQKLKNEEYIRMVNEQLSLLKLKHDFKNHLITLKSYIKQGETGEAGDYIENLFSHSALKTYVNSNNVVINAILNQKISDYPDIDFIIRYDNGSYNLEPDKLTIIFGNAIDNAIEAVQKMDNDANIRIILSENDELIKIFIANPFVVHPVFSDGKLVSIKESKYSGVGMMNIEEATRQVAGTLRYGVKDDMFELVILVHMNGLLETA